MFTLENVPRYQNSQSFAIILDALESLGYKVDYSVVNMADFGLPQARRRLVLIANKGFHIALPSGTTPCSWYGAFTKCGEGIAHLIPTMPNSHLLPKQQQALEKFLARNAPTPLLIERVGGRTQSKYKPGQCKQAGITKKMSPHRVRHSAITTVLDLNNGNYRATQRFSRHAQVQTVLKYDDNRQRLQKQMSDSISELI